ncbi:hypothetical protein BDP81DRAFT_62560 [Colletotrichum phormii]|uniref:Uncharacterized protein n=1 Tax=Colletotrichum phormii TaxID=359342 RepID=A0AAI9ZNH6_9PEZI|nr:uncharacterized protein BDP81DRAFT_62560 [Colletotrichum phormii]KAK1633884.1 hypothetical protein BDP81DRAFT_62560 [Colletotrichum phormii]
MYPLRPSSTRGFLCDRQKGPPGLGDERREERMVERHLNTDTKSEGSELRGQKEAVFRQRFGCCCRAQNCGLRFMPCQTCLCAIKPSTTTAKVEWLSFTWEKKSTQFQITGREQGSSVSAHGRFQSFSHKSLPLRDPIPVVGKMPAGDGKIRDI